MRIPRINPRFQARLNSRVSQWALPSSRWYKVLITGMFMPEDAQRILKLPPPFSERKDKLLWCNNRTGKFSVKGIYNHLFNRRVRDFANGFSWKTWWNLKMHPRNLL